MQFIKDGPNVPERLLQEHEEGNVVFFCGAGISMPMLPDFARLAKNLYERLGVTPNALQKTALDSKQYDTAIGLLEADYAGGRKEVRKEIASILSDYKPSPKATATHEALLTLGRCRNGNLRVVTTNFDRLFENMRNGRSLNFESFQAPLLPVPKARWNGLVYLHGLLPSEPSENELDCLVVSSGDYGLAYLTERWASRFVSELFRHYTVCFVGYSINDPVIRYMTDALAADRQRGESSLEMYAFGGYTKGKKGDYEEEWKAKNVTPILYWQIEHHRYLHKTLNVWAETYRDGVRGKEQIVVKEASSNPLMTTAEDDFVGRVLWAISDKSGLPAKRFAEHNPVPSLDWLKPLSENRFGHSDLRSFGVAPQNDDDSNLVFSLTHRPTPYNLAPWMVLFKDEINISKWDKVMYHLAEWLKRHLDDPNLVLWLTKRGGQLHNEFARIVDQRLDELAELEKAEKTEELNKISANAPYAIPRPMMRSVWRLLLSGRIKTRLQNSDLFQWLRHLKHNGLTPSLRMDFKNLMEPCIELREPFRLPEEVDDKKSPKDLKGIIDWELKLRSDHVHSTLSDVYNSENWKAALPELLPDLVILLKEALDLMRELGGADEKSDHSYLHQPSISEHPQNRKFRDWTALIDLTREAWLGLCERSKEQATVRAHQWQQTPYPLFKRLAFFAASKETIIQNSKSIDWLLADECWWLWSIETQREVLRLLVSISPQLRQEDRRRLEAAILEGPPRSMFKDDVGEEKFSQIIEHEIWLRLKKMEMSGAALGKKAQAALEKISEKYPDWKLFKDEREEFPFWMGGGDELRKFVATPRRRRELVEWLKQNPQTDHWQEDDWRQRCRDEFEETAYALRELANESIWPVDRWREALQAWSEEKLLDQSWRNMAAVLMDAPEEIIIQLSHSISWWLQEGAQSFSHDEDLFFSLCLRILDIDIQEGLDTGDPVNCAINHPAGLTTKAVLSWWYKQELRDNQGLPDRLLIIFDQLCDPEKLVYRYARVLLAAHVIPIFRVDPQWSKKMLLPFFDWHKSEAEAKSAWCGFLWAPRLYYPFLDAVKSAFLETAEHYDELGDHGAQYATLMTFAALDAGETFTKSELKMATEALPDEGRVEALQAIVRALEGAGEQAAVYWRNRVLPYWKSIWPKSHAYKTKSLAEPLARICVAAHEAFPEAFEKLKHWLQLVDYPGVVIHKILEEKLPQGYPEEVLFFLDKIINVHNQLPLGDLKKLLNIIKQANPQLEVYPKYQRLIESLRKHGRS